VRKQLRRCGPARLRYRLRRPHALQVDDDDIDSAPPVFTRQASGNVVTLQYRAPEVCVRLIPLMRAAS
jgi:hypothetical protein